ncbi:hypothetical protein RD792_006622 [Penstemon davidsonii]|uniref:Uncharacterized protein n=1 Tax=Penstemon davidsonii TaxID=160366 RepID=A0ABR0DX83_9LAMI|nr:hypothetical protein RD792_006622 [Penstemon davidsonii]
MGRAGKPHEIESCFVFLASEESSYYTGQILHPNGNRLKCPRGGLGAGPGYEKIFNASLSHRVPLNPPTQTIPPPIASHDEQLKELAQPVSTFCNQIQQKPTQDPIGPEVDPAQPPQRPNVYSRSQYEPDRNSDQGESPVADQKTHNSERIGQARQAKTNVRPE